MRGQRGLTQIQRAIAFLRSLGTNAHVWLPGANGVSVASLPSNNFLLSDGSTGYSTVDGVDGLTLDGMGALSSTELSTPFDGTYTANTGVVCSGGVLTATAAAAGFMAFRDGTAVSVGKTYLVTGSYSTSSAFTVYLGGAMGAVVSAGAGTFSQYIVAAATSRFQINANNTLTGTISNVSVKEYTGAHLTQATTANKPIVRRGMFNELTYSNTLSNAAWVTQLTASKSGSNLLLPAVSDNLYQATTLPAGPLTIGVVMSGTGTVSIFGYNFTQGPFGITSFALTSTPTIYAVPLVATAANTTINIGRLAGDTATSVTLGGMGMFKGSWTAAQILAEGGIPPTTATAASNPSAGKYWWSFNHADVVAPDNLLSGNLAITNAVTIVIAGRVNSLAATQVLFGEDTTGLAFFIEGTTGLLIASKNGTAQLVNSTGFPVTAGVPFVLTFRLSGGTAVIRRNGVQVATAGTALTFAATTGARIGSDFAGTSYPLNGALGWVVPIAAALSDADCLTVERLVGQQFPGMATF